MRRYRKTAGMLVFAFAVLAGSSPAYAGSLDLAYNNVGISFGNSKKFTGLRFNLKDNGIREIDGINATFWVPGENQKGRIRGLSLGLIGVNASRVAGLNLGLVGVTGEYVDGVSVGLVGLAATERMRGIGIGGIGMGGGEFTGIMVGGIGLGGESMTGLAVGGVGIGATTMRGVGAGLVGIGGEDLKGVYLGGIGVGAESFTGFGVGLVGVGGEKLKGLFAGGVGVGCETLTGVGISLFGVAGETLEGAAVTVVWNQFEDARWLATGAVNRARYRMTGIQIGLINVAESLHGVQLGLINFAGNNPKYLRVLPIINMHL